jgi:DNA polymerase III delta prime subunit
MVASRSLFHDQRCILIDEIDGATLNAQKALRALVESDIDCAWICTANESRKIIPPLLSRMMLIDCSYASLQRREAHFLGIIRRCKEILAAETVEISEAELRHVVELNYPDVRQTINALQLCSRNRIAA